MYKQKIKVLKKKIKKWNKKEIKKPKIKKKRFAEFIFRESNNSSV